ncbi:hypothetical protein L3X38_044127 [Prunus dulcis]|uniref:SCP domain-containing protein n=1 Tax=Prunus dulcis TaxID=3755 RepID=A0AAD4UZJ9_PRUDU|nr:hypothetical protein L3X38_044127 [Prunus dulcis]
MGLSKILIALVCVLGFALLQSTHAQDTPQDYVTAHNNARAAVNVGPLSWDEKLQGYAQDYANQHIGDCNLVHSGGPYGENLAMSTADLSGTDAVNMWVAEKADYNYDSNTCADGKMCGHYTQVVWRNTARVGCAKVRCNSGGLARAQNAPDDYVKAHNAARAAVSLDTLDWDEGLADSAKNYANQRAGDCDLVHSNSGPGENLAMSPDGDLTAKLAVDQWVAEKADYDYKTNTCAPGKQCGHYTQVVWRDTGLVGCAKVQCAYGGSYVVCHYDPAGNSVGVKPY